MDKDNLELISELDECFETGVVIDGTGVDLDEMDKIMKGYLSRQKS